MTDRRETFLADDGDAGERLDKVLAARAEALSRARVQALIAAGHVQVDGGTISEADYRVKPGQTLAIFVPDSIPAIPEGQPMALAVLYEDSDLIVIDKPAGLVVHPAPGNPDRTLVNALIAHCGDSLSGIGGVRRPGIVHRLDKDTSGVMVAAKNDPAHRGLADQFANHSIRRVYTALVWGDPPRAEGRIEGAIGRDPRNRKKMAVVRRGGKSAATEYRVRKRYGGVATLVDCTLETGRTHQIRVHMASIGHPVVGDPLYARGHRSKSQKLPESARKALESLGRQALHARILGFRHPASAEWREFESSLPSDLHHLLNSLETL